MADAVATTMIGLVLNQHLEIAVVNMGFAVVVVVAVHVATLAQGVKLPLESVLREHLWKTFLGKCLEKLSRVIMEEEIGTIITLNTKYLDFFQSI